MFEFGNLEVKAFTKKYRQGVTIDIQPININQKVVVVTGPNGSGKTTLLKAIAGLIQYQGEIIHPKNPMYVEELVRYPEDMIVDDYLMRLIKLGCGDYQTLDKLLEYFAMRDKRFARLRSLSKGMKQKVNLIQAFTEKRLLYLLDEPFEGLDQHACQQVIQWMRSSASQYICSTHNASWFDTIVHQKICL